MGNCLQSAVATIATTPFDISHSIYFIQNKIQLKKALSLAADVVFGNYWWYAFNTIVCFRGYVNVAHLYICA
jgi:hypothetical protein